jgi:hypothetical protein
LTKAFVYGASIIHMRKVPQLTVIVITAALTVIMWISTLAMVIPQAAYAQQNEVNPYPLSSSSVDSCASDELPASINGGIQCMRQGECYSEQFEGKEVKHCNFMMSGSDE